jgi:heat shock protein HtpX
MKRITLFLLTNLLVLAMITIVFTVFGLEGVVSQQGLNLTSLLVLSAVIGFGGAFLSLAMSRTMAKWMAGVRVIDPRQPADFESRWVLETTHALARKAGMKVMPEVGIYDSPEVNAFATGPGRNRSIVAVSRGLLHAMDRGEAEAVLAHEVAHIVNGDMVTLTLLQGVVNTFVIAISRVVGWIAMRFVPENVAFLVYIVVSIAAQIVFGILSMPLVMAFSRWREFKADAGAARLAGRDKMIAALERLRVNKDMIDTSQPALATMKISGRPSFAELWSSHPPLEARIARLRSGA